MISLRRIERAQRDHFGHDGGWEHFGCVDPADVGLGGLFLVLVGVEDDGAVLSADVGALAIFLGGVVGDGEKDLQKLAIGDLGRIVGDLDGFGVTGGAVFDNLVVGGLGLAAGIAGDGL